MTTAITQTIINGVDVTRLAETVQAVKANPALAQFQFRTRNRWITGGHNSSTIQQFYGAGAEDTSRTVPFTVDADEQRCC